MGRKNRLSRAEKRLQRRSSRSVTVGNLELGGQAPVRVQSMLKVKTTDIESALAELRSLERAGCELIRIAVPETAAVPALAAIKKAARIPVVADVHFDWRLALGAIKAGADKIRVNPGNIGGRDRFKEVILAARDRGVPMRIGANSGSVHADYRETGSVPEALVESLLTYVAICENAGFEDLVLSVKSSSVLETVEAYRLLAEKVDYPLHLGVTEAGTLLRGTVKSVAGLGILLAEGIGDTIRVSLTAEAVREVEVAYQLLQALELRVSGPELISCPTCGRCDVDLMALVEQVESYLNLNPHRLKVAVMGCVVNGPGEAREADLGIAAGKGTGLLFKRGQPVRKLTEGQMVTALISEIEKMAQESAPQQLSAGPGSPDDKPVVRPVPTRQISCQDKE